MLDFEKKIIKLIESKLNKNKNKKYYSLVIILYYHDYPIDIYLKINKIFPSIIFYWFFIFDYKSIICSSNHGIKKIINFDFNKVLNPLGLSTFRIHSNLNFLFLPDDYKNEIIEYIGNNDYINLDNINFKKEVDILKPWDERAYSLTNIDEVIILGAGIAGAITARILANYGIKVLVIEKDTIANKASGNKQGILYAKISAHNTNQTLLLLSSYCYALHSLYKFLPQKKTWNDSGVLHLDYSTKEKEKNINLTKNKFSLFKYLKKENINNISGIEFNNSGLFWPYGAWLNPKSLIEALLDHNLITVHDNTIIDNIYYDNDCWTLSNNKKTFKAQNVVLCQGADSIQFYKLLGLNFFQIRGQTTLVKSSNYSKNLKIAISGNSYICPEFEGNHCIGATFKPNSNDDSISNKDDDINIDNLRHINEKLYLDLLNKKIASHASLRCDSFDHLPVVGRIEIT